MVGTSSRMGWMDMLRGIAVLFVILGHVPSVPADFGGHPPSWIFQVWELLAAYRVPMLMFLSGMLLHRSLEKGLPTYYNGKWRNIVWPFVIWTLITALVINDLPNLLHGATWVFGSYHLWFLAVLCGCYLIAPVTRVVPPWVLAITMVLLATDQLPHAYDHLLWFGAFFFAGAAAHRWVPVWQAQRPAIPAVMAAFSVGYGIWVAVSGQYTRGELRAFVPSLVGIAALLWVAPRLPRIDWLETVGRDSIVYFLAHFPALVLVWLAMRSLGAPWLGWWVTIPTLAVVGLGVPVLFKRLRDTPLFRAPRQGSVTVTAG